MHPGTWARPISVKGNYTAALGELLKAERLNPDDPILHNDLGLAYMAKEKIDLAVVHFEKAVQLKPDLLPGQKQPGQCLYGPAGMGTRPSPY